jgi:hypothetical protein
VFVEDCGAVTTIDDVEQAYRAIGEAEHAYRDTVRKALAEKTTTQAAISRRLGRSREMLRQDAMTEDERAAIRAAELERQRARRASGKAE